MIRDRKTLCLALAVVMLSAGTLYADITSNTSLHNSTYSLASHPVRTLVSTARLSKSSSLAGVDGLKSGIQVPLGLDFSGNVQTSDTQKAEVKDLPAGPNSAMLFLCALGSVGVFHAGKSARKINFAAVPDWYHSGGLRQVGHVHALELDFYLVAMPMAAFFDQPGDNPPKIHSRYEGEIAGRFKSQFSFPPQAPRGPPIFS